MTAPRVAQVSRGDLVLDVRDAGPADGDPVLLLHGFPQDAGSWDAVAERLHGAGLRTLAPDQRGYSPRAQPRAVGAYAIGELVADALAVADAVGAERFHLAGHDWGGGVAWGVAQAAPQRVRSLTIASTPHPAALLRSLRTPAQLRRSWYMAAFQLPVVPERYLAGRVDAFLARAGLPAGLAERYGARFSSPESLRGPVNWYRAMRSTRTGPDGPVRVPTTYVWGNRDVALGRGAAEATEAYVEADYRFVELDAGHWLPELNAAEVADEVIARAGA